MLQKKNTSVLIESTSNQVDQFGGYTGLTPEDFKNNVFQLARKMNFPSENIILGGDHLGPNVWQNENSESALKKAEDQIAAYIKAGYTKIHLDTSMKCADDGNLDEPLETEVVAERAVRLCKVAEKTFQENNNGEQPVYIIGSDVPPPGGAKSRA
ncbi:MAG: class II D-tagatose-bisphosphate aldolase, non-catalytic subunit [Melioribacteraceae bacterium]|nr:class II D-tagatose-bisphosphate aldolase, non-catalytic subunit [Melioribacteraceae bacterium]